MVLSPEPCVGRVSLKLPEHLYSSASSAGLSALKARHERWREQHEEHMCRQRSKAEVSGRMPMPALHPWLDVGAEGRGEGRRCWKNESSSMCSRASEPCRSVRSPASREPTPGPGDAVCASPGALGLLSPPSDFGAQARRTPSAPQTPRCRRDAPQDVRAGACTAALLGRPGLPVRPGWPRLLGSSRRQRLSPLEPPRASTDMGASIPSARSDPAREQNKILSRCGSPLSQSSLCEGVSHSDSLGSGVGHGGANIGGRPNADDDAEDSGDGGRCASPPSSPGPAPAAMAEGSQKIRPLLSEGNCPDNGSDMRAVRTLSPAHRSTMHGSGMSWAMS
mmetsp:Transcript_22802/g.65743  ORF Transcript_22802/g.65743 Transcript_22802/m.65743 type:complete len:335 (-) Transcript_22802:350-1354(-)